MFKKSILLALALFAITATAQTYPSKPVKLVVPYPAGGFPDTVARIFAKALTERMGQSFVVENKSGANGVVAAQALTGAPRDGYTLLVTDGSMFSINPAIYKNLGYDAKKDFVPVSLAARAPLYLAVNSKSSFMTIQDVIREAKANPGKLTYGSSGIGSTHHLSHEAMNQGLGVNITHVPFKGTGQSVPALVGGQIDMLFSAIPQIGGFVKGGQLRLLINNSPKRSIQEPQIATLAENLIPGFDFSPKVGFLAAAGTPQAIIDRVSTEIIAIAKLPDVMQLLGNAGIEPLGTTPADYARIMAQEADRLGKAVQAAKIQAE